MCIAIKYTFPTCNHTLRTGEYTCYAAKKRGKEFDTSCERFKDTSQKVKVQNGDCCQICAEKGALEMKEDIEVENVDSELSLATASGENGKSEEKKKVNKEDKGKGEKKQNVKVEGKKPKIGLLAMLH